MYSINFRENEDNWGKALKFGQRKKTDVQTVGVYSVRWESWRAPASIARCPDPVHRDSVQDQRMECHPRLVVLYKTGRNIKHVTSEAKWAHPLCKQHRRQPRSFWRQEMNIITYTAASNTPVTSPIPCKHRLTCIAPCLQARGTHPYIFKCYFLTLWPADGKADSEGRARFRNLRSPCE